MAKENLDAIAAAELIREAKRGAERAKVMGAMGWRRCPLPTANKVFLNNTLLGIVGHSKRQQHCADRKAVITNERRSFNESSRKRPNSPSHSSYFSAQQKIGKIQNPKKNAFKIRQKTKKSFDSHFSSFEIPPSLSSSSTHTVPLPPSSSQKNKTQK